MPAAEHILFLIPHRKTEEPTELIKLLPHEKVLTVQKKHWITLVIPLLLHAIAIVLLFGGIILLILQHFHPSIPFIAIDSAFLVLSILSTLGIYTCMDWYYQFYIITNLRVINIRFFKIKGEYYNELFMRKGSESEIKRNARNLLYDFLNIEDIYIQLHREERIEPFILEVPNNPQQIEELLEEITIGEKGAAT